MAEAEDAIHHRVFDNARDFSETTVDMTTCYFRAEMSCHGHGLLSGAYRSARIVYEHAYVCMSAYV